MGKAFQIESKVWRRDVKRNLECILLSRKVNRRTIELEKTTIL